MSFFYRNHGRPIFGAFRSIETMSPKHKRDNQEPPLDFVVDFFFKGLRDYFDLSPEEEADGRRIVELWRSEGDESVYGELALRFQEVGHPVFYYEQHFNAGGAVAKMADKAAKKAKKDALAAEREAAEELGNRARCAMFELDQ